jgi:hypothetical protein
MGEKQNGPFQLPFNASLKVDFQGSRVTSDSGLILVRELDERLGFRGREQRALVGRFRTFGLICLKNDLMDLLKVLQHHRPALCRVSARIVL